MNRFIAIDPHTLSDNVFQAVGKDWMLITAGDQSGVNTMTASWGGWGVLWNKPVVFIFVRPSRHTYAFLEKQDTFSLSFFGGEQREALQYCGRISGRDADKFAQTGLTAVTDTATPYIAQASLVLCCRKLYYGDIDPQRFLDPAIAACYPGDKDYHRVYIGEIEQVLRAE